MTDSARPVLPLSARDAANSAQARRDLDDGILADLLQNGALFGDLSLERWLDRVVFREDRA
jgi:hypothetical protein